MRNSIGSARFLTLHGSVERPSEQVLGPIVRPGLNGIGLWKTGIRGRPFQLRSMVDQYNILNGRTLFAMYRLLIGNSPQILVQDGYNFNFAEGFRVAVLDVRLIELKRIMSGVGGFYSIPGAKLVCQWTMIAVANFT